ncbi:MAG: hypothetical protein DYG89_21195 [Caldilinea sp. CFX5]|nr:hypothetical protein [Caldilinea sp. CFX5]
MTTAPLPITGNPYVGPLTFTEQDAYRFFGRDREARELLALVLSERMVLFYAQSGAGKSSLLHARLIPNLRTEGFDVLPVGRVGGALPLDLDPATVPNIFIFNLLARLNEGLPAAERLNVATLAGCSLTAFLGADEAADATNVGKQPAVGVAAESPMATIVSYDTAPTVLIIDQFEELITTHLDQWRQRAAFFTQLRAAQMHFPNLWIVLTMREDYIAALDPYTPLLPDRLRARFYMQRMSFQAALEAVQRPAADLGQRPFAPDAAHELVNNLRLIQDIWQVDETPHFIQGEFVEPVQLQVVCFQLWERLISQQNATDAAIPAPAAITLADLTALAGDKGLADFVNQALRDYYEQALRKVLALPNLGLSERQVRDWFSLRLISEETRSLVRRSDEEAGGLPIAAVDLLETNFLIRADVRSGGIWYELVHDRFVQPILEANRAWLLTQNNPVTAVAALWAANDRTPAFLLHNPQLQEAQRFADENPQILGELERAFLEASTAQAELEAEAARQREMAQNRALAEAARERARRTRYFAIGLAVLLVVAVAATFYALDQRRAAQNQAEIAAAFLIANNSLLKADSENDTTLLLATEAYQVYDAPETRSQLLYANARNYEPELAILRAHEDQIWGAVFSPDGQFIATASLDSSVQLWDPTTYRPIRRLQSPEIGMSLFSLAVSKQYIAAGTRGGYVLLWDVQTGELTKTLSIDYDTIYTLAFSPDEQRLATGGAEQRVKLTDLTTWRTRRIGRHTKAVRRVAFSPDGLTLASASTDKTIRLWDLDPHVGITSTLALTEHNAAVTGLAFYPSPTTTVLASGDMQGKIIFWDLMPWRNARQRPITNERRTWQKHASTHTVWDLAFNPTGSLLASASSASTFKFWRIDLSRGAAAIAPETYSLFLDGHTAGTVAVDFSLDGKSAVVASLDSTASVWQVSSGNLLAGQPGTVQSLALSPDEQTLFAASGNGTVRAWDAGQRRLLWERTIQPSPLIKLSKLAPDASLLATSNVSGTLALWSIEPAHLQRELRPGHQAEITALAFTTQGDKLASADDDGIIYLWDAKSGQRSEPLLGHERRIHALAFSPDGKLLASSSCGNEVPVCFADVVRIWEVATGYPVGEPLQARQGYVNTLVFANDNATLASGSTDYWVIVWDLNTRRELYTHKQHTYEVLSLAFSPDNQLLASGGDLGAQDDRTGSIILWDVSQGARFGRSFNEHDGSVTALLFSRDGKMLYSGGRDGYIVIHDLQIANWQQRACRLANRNLSALEWRRYVGPARPYHKTCPQWPDGDGIVNGALPTLP